MTATLDPPVTRRAFAVPAEPVPPPEPTRRRVSRVERVAVVATVLGAIVVLFALHQFVITDIYYERSQRLLGAELRQYLLAASGGGDDEEVPEGQDGLLGRESAVSEDGPPPPGPGDPVALLTIPRLGLEAVVVQGTGSDELAKGPGHFRNTPMPGEPGNVGIAGHRTTHGAPFRGLDDLEAGDEIKVSAAGGHFTYRVTSLEVLDVGDRDPLTPGRDPILTLVTSNPAYRASERLVVTGELDGTAIIPNERIPTSVVDPGESGLGGTGTWAAVIVWVQFTLLALVGAWWLRRNWLRWPAYAVAVPILLFTLFQLFESVSALMPSTL